MSNRKCEWRVGKPMLIATLMGFVLILAALFSAKLSSGMWSETELFLREKGAPQTLDTFSTEKDFALHATFYSIWVTMLLSLPAFCLLWYIKKSPKAGAYWLAFWTISFFAMLVHLYFSMGLLFEWDWTHILKNTERVSSKGFGLFAVFWWGFDALLGWCLLHSRGRILHTQRIAIHLIIVVLLLAGFISKGELLTSKLIGIIAATIITISFIHSTFWNRKRLTQ